MANDTETTVLQTPESSAGRWIILGVAALFALGASYFIYDGRQQSAKVAQDLAASNAQIADLNKRMQSAEADSETLAKQLGMTKKELADRAERYQAQQKVALAKMSEEQKKDITAVSGDIANVKTDVGGVKTDVASTKTELASAEAKLQSAVGDLGVQSGLIANTRQDLETLKHKGDRNYYEFTLEKGAKPQPVGTVSLQLKKADEKRGKFTLNVSSDDKTIEKKDRNVSEPIQFYSGRDHMLYEVVVWTVNKKQATGYLSTPKGAPVPVSTN